MVDLKDCLEQWGIPFSDQKMESFETYANMLLKWNEKLNLTAITDRHQIEIKHFLDSVYLLKFMELKAGQSMVDVGTGAGFPSVPLKILCQDINLTLLDSLQKRLGFLQELSMALGQDNKLVHARAEDCLPSSPHREQYDFSVSRAVAALPALCEYCLPYVRVGGLFVAWKGYDIEDECHSAGNAIGELGGQLEAVENYRLLEDYGRSLVFIRKIEKTPKRYPRKHTKITKTPL